ncbi:MAG: RraA family protein [Hyphomicrobiales bacterium]|nr:RraA family protein [Hyphomicrobiales bacterium]
MPIQRHETDFATLSPETLARWREIPPAIASDCMNRTHVMAGAIKPVAEGMAIAGQARTVACMVGDNSALHRAIGLAAPGEVLVVDGGGFADTAIWGGIMTRAALQYGIAGLVIDGAVRDVAEIRELGFACFARAVVPAGPHKGFGGIIDGAIACAGCPVSPGDLVLGDDDGVCVVPLAHAEEILAASLDKIAQEEQTNADTAAGKLPADTMGLPEIEVIGRE